MIKPPYETAQDREHQDNAKKFLADAWGIEIHDLYDPLYRIDWYSNGGSRPMFMEYKRRHCYVLDYSWVILSLSKYMTLMQYNTHLDASIYYICEFDNGMWYYDLSASSSIFRPVPELVWGGNKKRNGPGDMEPCLKLLNSNFKPVEKPNKDEQLQ